jgi:hypothetical protein
MNISPRPRSGDGGMEKYEIQDKESFLKGFLYGKIRRSYT